MRNIQIYLTFDHCLAIKGSQTLVPAVEFMAAQGFRSARSQEQDGPLVPVTDLERDVLSYYGGYEGAQVEDVASPLLVDGFTGLSAHYRYAVFFRKTKKYSRLEIGGLVDFEFKDQRHYVEPFAQKLRDLGLRLYPIVRPLTGWIDKWPDKDEDPADTERRMKHLGWITFLGPDWVSRYGQDFLFRVPGYQIGKLPDGGVYHQLTATFIERDGKEARRVRKAVREYFAQADYKVTCKAPYAIPQGSPPAEIP